MKAANALMLFVVAACQHGADGSIEPGHGAEVVGDSGSEVEALPDEALPPGALSYTFTVPNNPTYPNCSKALQLTATAQGGGRVLSVRPNSGDTYTLAGAGAVSAVEKWWMVGQSFTIDKDLNSSVGCMVLGPRSATVTYTGTRPRLQYWWTDCWCDHD